VPVLLSCGGVGDETIVDEIVSLNWRVIFPIHRKDHLDCPFQMVGDKRFHEVKICLVDKRLLNVTEMG
jgi:hypothetical protein